MIEPPGGRATRRRQLGNVTDLRRPWLSSMAHLLEAQMHICPNCEQPITEDDEPVLREGRWWHDYCLPVADEKDESAGELNEQSNV